MSRSLVYLVMLAALVLTSCTSAAHSIAEPTRALAAPAIRLDSTPTGEPTAVPATPDLSRLVSDRLASGKWTEDGQPTLELTDWARDASGLRDALGPQADDIFLLADQVQAAAVQDVLRLLQAKSKPKGMPAPLPPRMYRSVELNELEVLGSVLSVLLMSPGKWESPQDGGTNPITSVNEFDQKVGENAQAHAKMTSTITGSQMEVQVDMTVRVEKDGKVLEERASGTIRVNICPNPQGDVPMDITLQGKADVSGGGYSIQFSDHAVAHVDDEANLTGIDHEVQSEMSMTKGKNWLTGAPDTSFVQVNLGITLGGLTSKDPRTWSVSHREGSKPRASLFVSKELTEHTVESGVKFAVMAGHTVFRNAEEKWQGGHCVAVAVPEGESQRVMKGSETRFTATVRHKFEDAQLTVPVIATLTGGTVSVTPSGIKVTSPASFRYKAPEESGKEATVELVSRSRRGIGKLNVTFKISEQFYTVKGAWANSEITVGGTICAFDKPFTLKLGGHKPNGTPYTGKVEFIPTDATRGSWKAEGTYTIPYAPPAYDSAASTYHVTGLADGRPMIKLDAFTQKGHSALFSASFDWPGMDIPLIVETGTCYSE